VNSPQGAFGPPQPPYGHVPQQQNYPAYPAYPAMGPGAGYAPHRPPYAGWPQRAGAFLLDIALNFGPIWVLTGLAAAVGDRGENSEVVGTILGWAGLLVLLGTVVYQLVSEGQRGQTVGKRVLGIRTVRDRDGQMPGIGLALARRIAEALNCPLLGLGWWWPLWDDKRQTFADKISGVVVVRADAAPPFQGPWQ
jgi:uncharacterized RDD family membrane protein YckC